MSQIVVRFLWQGYRWLDFFSPDDFYGEKSRQMTVFDRRFKKRFKTPNSMSNEHVSNAIVVRLTHVE